MTKFKKRWNFSSFRWFCIFTLAFAVTGATVYNAVFSSVEINNNNATGSVDNETHNSDSVYKQSRAGIEDISVPFDAYNRMVSYTYDTSNSVIDYSKLALHEYGDSSAVDYWDSHSRFETVSDQSGFNKIVFRAAKKIIMDNKPNFSAARVTYWRDSNVEGALPSFDYGFGENVSPLGIYQEKGFGSSPYYYTKNIIDLHKNENRPIEGIIRICSPGWHHPAGFSYTTTSISFRKDDGSYVSSQGYTAGWNWNSAPHMIEEHKRKSPLSVWDSWQHTFAAYDGHFWSITSRPGSVSLSLNPQFNNFNGSVYDFISSLNANNLHNYIKVNAFNLPSHCFGRNTADSRISFTADERNECLIVRLTVPRSFSPSSSLTSDSFGSELRDKNWVKNEPLTATLSIPFSKFKPRQAVTLPIDEISAENMRIFDDDGNMIFGEKTYSIDLIENGDLQNAIVDYINANPEQFFTNLPTSTEAVGRANIEPYSMEFSITPYTNSSAVTLNFNFLQRTPYQNAPAIYKNGSLIITNLNGAQTTANNEVDISDFQTNSYADEITTTNQDFINYLRQESTIKNIFKNYPESFVNYNKRFLELRAIESSDTSNGSIVVRLLAKRYAMRENGTFGDIEVTVTLYGLPSPIPPEPEAPGLKKSTYNISELNISGLRSNLYTLDVINDSSLQLKIEEVLLTRPQLFLKNLLTSVPEDVPHFQGFEFLDTGDEIILNTSYLHSYRDQIPTYNSTRIKFTGFNINNTTLKTNYRESSSNGLVISNVNDITAYDAIKSPSHRQRVEQIIKDNIDTMFDNKPRQFVEIFQNNFTLNEQNTKFINGSSQMIVTMQCDFSYYEKTYVTKQFKIKVSGFMVQPETNTRSVFSYEVDNVNDTFERLKEQLVDWLQKHPLTPNTAPYYFPDANNDNLINEHDFEIKNSIKGPVLKPHLVYNGDGVLDENDGSKWMYTNAVERGTIESGFNSSNANSKNNLNFVLLFWLSIGTMISIVVLACVITLVHKRLTKQEE